MTQTENVKIEEIPTETKQETTEKIDDLPELEEPQQKTETTNEQKKAKQTKHERKSKKAMAKLGLSPVNGVTKVTLKQSQILFVIDDPEVYSAGDTYVIFGRARFENLQQKTLEQLQQQLLQAKAKEEKKEEKEEKKEEEETDEAVDETGLEAKDIELVMKQANVSRGKAVKALRESNGDIVNAIMALTGV